MSLDETPDEKEKRPLEIEVVDLCGADWEFLVDALTRPPPPNAALRMAFAKYQALRGDSTGE